MGPVELFSELGLLNDRFYAVHCIFLEEEVIQAAGRERINLCYAPLGNATGAIAPIGALCAAGARVTLCTDTKSADLFEVQRMAIMVARIRA
jgi:5-methylthioadenosine/S-adenosylhomocysteine deaminase